MPPDVWTEKLRKGAAETNDTLQKLVPPRPRPGDNDPQLLRIGEQIRQFRNAQRMTQTALAARLGVTQQQVAKLEAEEGSPTVETLAKVADALGVRLFVEFCR
jgi:DNA-binding XRE family transcriptional regulator